MIHFLNLNLYIFLNSNFDESFFLHKSQTTYLTAICVIVGGHSRLLVV